MKKYSFVEFFCGAGGSHLGFKKEGSYETILASDIDNEMCEVIKLNNPEISNFVGYTLVDRNIRIDEGVDLIKFAVSKEPRNGFFLDSLGWAFYKLNDLKKAIIYLERAIELEPQEMEITDHLGDAYFKVDRKKEAKLVWERALSLDGNKDLLNKIKKKLETSFNYSKK